MRAKEENEYFPVYTVLQIVLMAYVSWSTYWHTTVYDRASKEAYAEKKLFDNT